VSVELIKLRLFFLRSGSRSLLIRKKMQITTALLQILQVTGNAS